MIYQLLAWVHQKKLPFSQHHHTQICFLGPSVWWMNWRGSVITVSGGLAVFFFQCKALKIEKGSCDPVATQSYLPWFQMWACVCMCSYASGVAPYLSCSTFFLTEFLIFLFNVFSSHDFLLRYHSICFLFPNIIPTTFQKFLFCNNLYVYRMIPSSSSPMKFLKTV